VPRGPYTTTQNVDEKYFFSTNLKVEKKKQKGTISPVKTGHKTTA
jgi:hypothetical protein